MGYDASTVAGLGVRIPADAIEESAGEEFKGFMVDAPRESEHVFLFWKDCYLRDSSGNDDEGFELEHGEYDKIYMSMKETLEPLGLWSHEGFGFWAFLSDRY